MITTMASHDLFPCLILPLLATLFARVFASDISLQASGVNPFPCSKQIQTCTASLYHINNGLFTQDEIASFYSVNSSQFKPIMHGSNQDYLITVPCSCQDIKNTTGYFYDVSYTVQPNDTFVNVSTKIYSGQAYEFGGEQQFFITGSKVSMHLLCGCVKSESQIVVTYTVQDSDTLSSISTLLSAKIRDIKRMNKILTQNPGFIDVGSVLFVPMEVNGIPSL